MAPLSHPSDSTEFCPSGPSPAVDLPTADDIAAAGTLLSDVIRATPLEYSDRISERIGRDVYLKREDIQVCRSYKVRGAFTFMSQLSSEERARGVVAASAGNHAQGVAFACQRLGINGTIFLPATTPRQKRERVAAIGGSWVTQVIDGEVFDDAANAAKRFAAETGAVVVPPFDSAPIVAGQGTVGMEILDQLAERGETPAAVLVPVGGAGLLAGVALWIKEHSPETRVIAVEPDGAASLEAALAVGRPIELPDVDHFVDGAAVKRIGDVPYELVRTRVDQVLTASDGAVSSEMLDLYQVDGVIAEPAGALASAVLREGTLDLSILPDGPIVAIISGGNNDVSRYAEVLERSLVHEGLRHYFLVTFPQQPGALRHFLEDVLTENEDIVLFEYTKKNSRETGPARVGIDLAEASALPRLLARMEASPLEIEKLTPETAVFDYLL